MSTQVPPEEKAVAEPETCMGCGLLNCCCAEFGDDEEWDCTFCGGEGYAEVDDPLWDDCDEFGWGECSACGGTGLRKHQTVF